MSLELTLDVPIEFMGMTLVKVWFNITYPTGYCQWAIQNAEGNAPIVSWFHFPQEVLDQWNDSDDVLFDYLRETKPWDEMIQQHNQDKID